MRAGSIVLDDDDVTAACDPEPAVHPLGCEHAGRPLDGLASQRRVGLPFELLGIFVQQPEREARVRADRGNRDAIDGGGPVLDPVRSASRSASLPTRYDRCFFCFKSGRASA